MATVNTTDPKPGFVYDQDTDTWYPLVGIAPASSITQWVKTAVGGETSVSGTGDDATTLSYTPGTEQVYLNGVLLVRNSDYTATNGTSITGLSPALVVNDVVEVITYNPSNIQITDAVLKTDITAKGDLIVGNAVDDYAILNAATTNGYILSVNSSTGTGLEWIANDQGDITAVTSGTGIEITNGTGPIPTIAIANAPTLTSPILVSGEERMVFTGTAATGTINIDLLTANTHFFNSNATGNQTINLRGSSTTSLNTILATNDTITAVVLIQNGSTAYYPTTFQVDGSAVTPKWQGGTAPSAGNASSIDAYVFTVMKSGSATYTVLASQTKFA